ILELQATDALQENAPGLPIPVFGDEHVEETVAVEVGHCRSPPVEEFGQRVTGYDEAGAGVLEQHAGRWLFVVVAYQKQVGIAVAVEVGEHRPGCAPQCAREGLVECEGRSPTQEPVRIGAVGTADGIVLYLTIAEGP